MKKDFRKKEQSILPNAPERPSKIRGEKINPWKRQNNGVLPLVGSGGIGQVLAGKGHRYHLG